MTRCANSPKCHAVIPEAEPSDRALCSDCLNILADRIMSDPVEEDPTTLRCQVCRALYCVKEARVVRSWQTDKGDSVSPMLCWVCARLRYSAWQQDAGDKEALQ